MFLISVFRAIKFSFQDIGRNIWLSVVTVTILVLALFTVNMLLVVDVISKAAVKSVKERIDVNIYLKPEASEEKIKALAAKIEDIKSVKSVKYISSAKALADFQVKHRKDPEILAALRELGKNPLSPVLVIKPRNVEQSSKFIADLDKIQADIIESRDFEDHKLVLAKIDAITKKINDAGIFISSVFILITILLVYNSVRVAIYTHRREIRIMRLVGASNWFIRLPYIFSSLIYTVCGLAIMLAAFFPFLNLLQPYLETFFVNYHINIVEYFKAGFFNIFGLELAALALVNIIASLIAVNKYSRV